MHIINLVDNLSKINFGIWNAALWTSPSLRRDYGIRSDLWTVPEDGWDSRPYQLDEIHDVTKGRAQVFEALRNRRPHETVIVSHGAWKFPTRWMAELSERGYSCIYVPHGMLQPWCLSQKKVKKKLYWRLLERKLALRADIVRAVGANEVSHLAKLLPDSQIRLLSNGIESSLGWEWSKKKNQILFLGRLYRVKRVAELVEAFASSSLATDQGFELVVAGPDQGEQSKIEVLQLRHPAAKIRCVGSVYGKEKDTLLAESRFFALPSLSEGFPTSVVEAMGAGCIPIISAGCNFPEALQLNLAIEVGTDVVSIRDGINRALSLPRTAIDDLAEQAVLFVRERYTLETVAKQLANLIHELLESKAVQKGRIAA